MLFTILLLAILATHLTLSSSYCQCEGYCGFNCQSACDRDSQCYWRSDFNECWNIQYQQKGVAVPRCSVTASPQVFPTRSPMPPSLTPTKRPTTKRPSSLQPTMAPTRPTYKTKSPTAFPYISSHPTFSPTKFPTYFPTKLQVGRRQ
jgi:hypothetical protein